MPLRLAVHLHLYYTEMWEEIKGYLNHMEGYPYDLYVTLIKDNPELIREIKAFHPQSYVFVIENRGYDIGPFVYFLHRIDLKQYDLVMKIHTKNNKTGSDTLINHRYINRGDWFKLLMGGIIGSREVFVRNMEKFEEDKKLGMAGSKYLITSNNKCSREVRPGVEASMKKLGYGKPGRVRFIAGTMFIVRSILLEKIKGNYELSDFMPTDGSVKDGTLAHVLERVFGSVVEAEGYKIKGYDSNGRFAWRGTVRMLRDMAYRRKITRHNYLLIKIFKLPVYRRKLAQKVYHA